MTPIPIPVPLPLPCAMHSSNLSGTSVLCAGAILRIISTGKLPWRRVSPGWYSLDDQERDDWSQWACCTAGYYQCGGLSWSNEQAQVAA